MKDTKKFKVPVFDINTKDKNVTFELLEKGGPYQRKLLDAYFEANIEHKGILEETYPSLKNARINLSKKKS